MSYNTYYLLQILHITSKQYYQYNDRDFCFILVVFSYYCLGNLVLPSLLNSPGPVTPPLPLELCHLRWPTPLPCWPHQGAINSSCNIAPPSPFKLIRKLKSASSTAPPLCDEPRRNCCIQSFTAVMSITTFSMAHEFYARDLQDVAGKTSRWRQAGPSPGTSPWRSH